MTGPIVFSISSYVYLRDQVCAHRDFGAGQVEVSRMDPDGTREHIGLATLQDRVECRCPAGVAVVFENVGDQPAHVEIDITGDASLSLPHEPGRWAEHSPVQD